MILTSNVNQNTTCTPIKINSLYLLSARLYAIQFVLLLFFGLCFVWLSRHESWDMTISRIWFDPLTRQFPWKNNAWLDLINHRLLKDIIITFGVFTLLRGVIKRQPRLILVAVLFGVGPLVVGILKATSAHSCPWSLIEFGGNAVAWPLFGSVPAGSGPGHCFPGGHASSGFSVMALFFLYWPERPKLAWFCWLTGVTLGLVMGFGQVMRGAHFFSHNLWAGWWVWLAQLIIFGCVSCLFNRKRKEL